MSAGRAVGWLLAVLLGTALASCAGTSSTILPGSNAGGTSMLPEAQNEDLLYVVGSNTSDAVVAFSYPKGKFVGAIPNTQGAQTLCSDSAGNVYVVFFAGPSDSSGYVVEYAHGGTTPIATFQDIGYYAGGCAIDPTTGNLAVANYTGTIEAGLPGNITVFPSNHSATLPYMDPQITSFSSCTYDRQGNLFAEGRSGFAEIPKGANALTNLTTNQSLYLAGWIQWDRHELAVSGGDAAAVIYHLRIKGTQAIITSATLLEGPFASTYAEFWIGGGTLVMPYGTNESSLDDVGFWRYPAGGYPTKTLSGGELSGFLDGLTVSFAPKKK